MNTIIIEPNPTLAAIAKRKFPISGYGDVEVAASLDTFSDEQLNACSILVVDVSTPVMEYSNFIAVLDNICLRFRFYPDNPPPKKRLIITTTNRMIQEVCEIMHFQCIMKPYSIQNLREAIA